MRDEVRSPDGSVLVALSFHESLPTQWIGSPRVTLERTGEVLLDLWDTKAWRWDAHASFDADGLLWLRMREYPGTSDGCVIVIDTAARTYRVGSGTPTRFLVRRLELQLRRAD